MPHTLTPAGVKNAQAAAAALSAAGLPAYFLPLALAQIAFETGGFASRVMATDNNLSGIKYIGSATVQKNATQGLKSPEGNYYARFASITDWARDYIRIISRGANPPIKATDTTDLAMRLKANAYYTDTVANYKGGLAAWVDTTKSVATATSLKKKIVAGSIIISSLIILALIYLIYKNKLSH